ncbi:MAG: PaREP1 family protein [Candidatus Thermoplasmatota archaeon]|nr:PaREP1 family protein [Candidatus Thermoplasmatota archaeon]MCG2826761.1 PaREP1 family protein [Thermoplasmatales archaeon]
MKKSQDMNDITSGFLKMRDHYLCNAEETIKKEELRKASELLWGAITQAIKALGSASNIYIGKHGEFFDFVRDVGKETKDKELYLLFLDLNALHKNFYDETIPSRDFPIYYEKAYLFLRKIDGIMKKVLEAKSGTPNKMKFTEQFTNKNE